MMTATRDNLRWCHNRTRPAGSTPSWFGLCLVVFFCCAGTNPPVSAQQPAQLSPRQLPTLQFLPVQQPPLQAPALLPVSQEELEQVIRDAQAMETQSRWADAMTHYETAMRLHNYNESLMERYRIARFHYDINRRQHDASYINLINNSKLDETVRFFNEVMNCVELEYADSPNWEQLFLHGIMNVKIAVTDNGFCKNAGLQIAPQQIADFLKDVQATIDRWEIRNREDLKNGLFHIAEKAKSQIGLNPVKTIMEFTCGFINSLDVYSTYLSPRQLSDQFSQISGNLVGLGVELRSDHTSLVIVRVIPGSPAAEAGLKDGDRILSVDGTSTSGRDTDSAADLLQGTEGTTVNIVVRPSGFGQQDKKLGIVRRQIDVPSVEDITMLTEKLGYVRLTSFQAKTTMELNRAITYLNGQGMQKLVLDMRGNPGGLFQVGIEVANMFLDNGAIVRTQGRNHDLDAPFLATQGNTWRMPLVVLIDEDSASAAEIVAGALRDHQRAVLVGKRTYGKGTVQKILPLRSAMYNGERSGLKLTVEKFYSPKGWAYSGVGVTPDVIIQEDKKQRVTLAKPVNGKVPRPISSRLDDTFIKEAVRVAESNAI